jgi:hypothetical protein
MAAHQLRRHLPRELEGLTLYLVERIEQALAAVRGMEGAG